MTSFEWAVIGAGPAGILAVGKLIDAGIHPQSIVWVDPAFQVGDLGKRWSSVSSNTPVRLFLDFLKGCDAFHYKACPTDFELHRIDPEDTCYLRCIVDPLQWVTGQLKAHVTVIESMVDHMVLTDRHWNLQCSEKTMMAKQVVLALGSEPKHLPLTGPDIINLEDALNSERLPSVCSSDDVVAVFGSSHSAILVLKNLMDCQVKRVINFYRDPLRYAVDMEDWVLFDNTGLKGMAAQWAREHLDGRCPKNLERVISSEEHLTQYLPECHKIVYAVGFERRHLPVIAGMESVQYNVHSGVIAPGLFGLGIAFPEFHMDPLGHTEYAVGLGKFMQYLDRVLPIWLKYGT